MGDLADGEGYPCLNPKCESSDARRKFADGTSFCFSCRTRFDEATTIADQSLPASKEDKRVTVYNKQTVEEIKEYRSRGFKERKISLQVCEFYGVKVSYGEGAEEIDAHYYPYDKGERYKVRRIPKEFSWIGPESKKSSENLFGQELFNPGGKRLIIAEGEIDALSIAQASHQKYQQFYPVVSLSSSTMTKAVLINRDWVRSFQEVIIFMDNDAAGQKATDECIKIIGLDKVKTVKIPQDCNDANDILKTHGPTVLLQTVFNASMYIPSGVIEKEEIWERLKNRKKIPAIPYPPCLEGVNTKLKGKRPGEIVLLISGTGSGKSTIVRENVLHDVLTSEDKVGVMFFEESPEETAEKLAGMAIYRNPSKEEIDEEDLKVGFDRVFGKDQVIVLDHQGSMSDERVIDKLEYMALMGCKYIYIDHITIMISEGIDNLTGNEAQDKIMSDLLKLVKRYPIWIGLVSHLRKTSGGKHGGKSFEEGRLPMLDDIRGSGSVKQISFDIIAFARNLSAKSDDARNTIKMSVLKARTTGLTGRVAGVKYDYDTGRLVALEGFDNEDDDDDITEI